MKRERNCWALPGNFLVARRDAVRQNDLFSDRLGKNPAENARCSLVTQTLETSTPGLISVEQRDSPARRRRSQEQLAGETQ
jgi:hypothetical protein